MELGALLPRDLHLAAAALAAAQANYRCAGKHFESVLTHNIEPLDPVALRLAHECYLRGGEPSSALGAVGRSMSHMTQQSKHSLQITSMFAVGYGEVRRN
jgi:lipopolysaccharide biosynthesis regulator YciM